MKQGFALQFSQNLSLTPSLQQAIRLLQMSHLELQTELHAQVQDNPFLLLEPQSTHLRIGANGSVIGVSNDSANAQTAAGMQPAPAAFAHTASTHTAPSDPPIELALSLSQDTLLGNDTGFDASEQFDLGISGGNSRAQSSDGNGNGGDDAGEYLGWVQASASSLREHLHGQGRLLRDDAVTLGVLGLMIDALTDDGYFEHDWAGILETLAQHCDVPNDAALHRASSAALHLLHRFDPPGVGAFGVQHCLQLQLIHPSPAECVLDAKTSTHALAQRVLNEGFECLAQRDRAGLKKRLKCDEVALGKAIELIRALSPKPGQAFAPDTTQYALPEILVIYVNTPQGGSEWQARLNAAVVPPLRVANTHAKYIKQKNATPEVAALFGQLHSAKQLLRTVQQHFDTVFRVGQAIVAAQQDFFSFGAKKIKPMVLRDIAQVLGLHESTVSRVTTKKYLQSPHGVFELKYFFSSALSSDNGDTSSSTAIKAHLQPLIQGEPPHKPLSDQALTDVLNAAGFQLARRTVAKYREQLGYPPAHARKPL